MQKYQCQLMLLNDIHCNGNSDVMRHAHMIQNMWYNVQQILLIFQDKQNKSNACVEMYG